MKKLMLLTISLFAASAVQAGHHAPRANACEQIMNWGYNQLPSKQTVKAYTVDQLPSTQAVKDFSKNAWNTAKDSRAAGLVKRPFNYLFVAKDDANKSIVKSWINGTYSETSVLDTTPREFGASAKNLVTSNPKKAATAAAALLIGGAIYAQQKFDLVARAKAAKRSLWAKLGWANNEEVVA